MNKDITLQDFISGSGGGKGSGSKTPVEAPNTLQSRSTIITQEVISEGETIGVVGGLKGVYLDDTIVQNADDSFNFQAVKFEERFGTETQAYMPGFPQVESAVVVNVEVETFLVRTVSDAAVDAARITLRLPSGLSERSTKTGDLNGYRVGIAIDVRPTGGGTWSPAITKTITGKTTTAYEESFRVDKPTGTTTSWDIRVRRTTTKAVITTISDRVDWFAYTEIQDLKVAYPYAGYVGLAFDSEATGGAIPGRSYLYDGVIIPVPTNYTPTAYNPDGSVDTYAFYTGIWDGTFKYEWCDCPAWHTYNMLINDRYGMGEYLDNAEIDIYSVYEASKYSAELVDDGTGTDTLSPRFTFNTILQARTEAYEVLQRMAATFRTQLFSGPGYIRFIQDRPTATSYYLNNSNVIGGQFFYSGTELAVRTTSCDVTFNDRLNSYNLRTINEEASSGDLAKYGFNKIELTALGCVNECEARRMAKWAIDTALNNSESVSFTVSFSNAFMEVGDVVAISDNWYAAEMFAGIIKPIASGTVDQIGFDRELTIASGTVIKYMTFDGVEITRTIATTHTGTTFALVNIPGNLINPNAYPNAPYSVLDSVEPRLFKVMSVKESDIGMYEVSAGVYDPNKFDRVESGTYVEPPVFTNIGNWTIGKPDNLVATPESYINPQGVLRYRLRFNWDDVTDQLLRGYKVQYRRNNNQYMWSPEVKQSEWTLEDAVAGVYEYNVYAYNTRGVQSPKASNWFKLEVGDGSGSLIDPVTNLELVGGGTAFTGTNFQITWDAPAEIADATLKDYEVKLYNGTSTSDPLIHSMFTTNNTALVFDRSDIIAWAGAAIRSIHMVVRARDTLERFSSATAATFTNVAPAIPDNIVVRSFFQNFTVEHDTLVGSDVTNVNIYASTTTGFTPGPSNLVLQDVGNFHLIAADASTTYYVKIAAVDSWSDTVGLLFSSQYTVTTLGVVGIVPTAPTGLAVTSVTFESVPGIEQAQLTATWNKTADADQYDLEIIEGVSAAYYPVVSQPTTGTTASYAFTGVPGQTYKLKVRSRAASNVSVFSSQVTHVAAADSTAPGAPTSFTVTTGFNAAALKWTNPSDTDIVAVQIYRTQTAPTSVAETLIATIASTSAVAITSYFDSSLVAGNVYSYRIRAKDRSGNNGTYTSLVSTGAVVGLPALSVDTAAIQAAAITGVKIAANTITAANILAGTITATQIAAGTITASNIAAGTITTNEIAANTITAADIAAGTITATQINTGSISAAILTANSITSTMIAAGNVTATHIGTNTIIASSANIGTGVIVNANIANATIEGAKIVDATITNAKIGGNLQSDNYVSATSGWQLNKTTGALELNGVTGGVGRTLLSGSGLNVYDSVGTLRVRCGIW